MSPELAKTMLHWEKNPLTEREIDVLRLANKGIATEQISKSLYLSKGTDFSQLFIFCDSKARCRNAATGIKKSPG